MATQNDCSISIVSAWISDPLFDTPVCDQCRMYLHSTLRKNWTHRIHNYRLTNFGSQLFGIRWFVQLRRIGTTESFDRTEAFLLCSNSMRDVLMAPIIDESLNTSLQSCIVLPSKDMTWSIPRCPLRSHYLVCIKNQLFIVGIGPILNK